MARRVHDEAEEIAGELAREYLECRGYGHMFRPLSVKRDPNRDGWVQTMRCRGCSAERDVYVSSSGYLSRHSSYRYPDGYLVKDFSLVDKAGRAAVRRVLFG